MEGVCECDRFFSARKVYFRVSRDGLFGERDCLESKIVQSLCIWTNSLLVILEFADLEKIHLRDNRPTG